MLSSSQTTGDVRARRSSEWHRRRQPSGLPNPEGSNSRQATPPPDAYLRDTHRSGWRDVSASINTWADSTGLDCVPRNASTKLRSPCSGPYTDIRPRSASAGVAAVVTAATTSNPTHDPIPARMCHDMKRTPATRCSCDLDFSVPR